MTVTGTEQRVYGTLVSSGGVNCWKYIYNQTRYDTSPPITTLILCISNDGTIVYGTDYLHKTIFAIHTEQPPNVLDAEVIWKSDVLEARISSMSYHANTIHGNVLCVATYLGEVGQDSLGRIHLINADTGESIWTTTSPISMATAALIDDVIYAVSTDRYLYVYNVSNGTLNWSIKSYYVHSGLAQCVIGNHYYGFYNPTQQYTYIRMINLTTHTLDLNQGHGYYILPISIHVASTYIFVKSSTGTLFWISPTDLSIIRINDTYHDVTNMLPMYIDESTMRGYIAIDEPAGIVCIDIPSGDEIWRYTIDDITSRCITSVTHYNNTVYIGYILSSDISYLYSECGILAVNKETGSKLWTAVIDTATDEDGYLANPRGIIVANENTVFTHTSDYMSNPNSTFTEAVYGVANKCTRYMPIVDIVPVCCSGIINDTWGLTVSTPYPSSTDISTTAVIAGNTLHTYSTSSGTTTHVTTALLQNSYSMTYVALERQSCLMPNATSYTRTSTAFVGIIVTDTVPPPNNTIYIVFDATKMFDTPVISPSSGSWTFDIYIHKNSSWGPSECSLDTYVIFDTGERGTLSNVSTDGEFYKARYTVPNNTLQVTGIQFHISLGSQRLLNTPYVIEIQGVHYTPSGYSSPLCVKYW